MKRRRRWTTLHRVKTVTCSCGRLIAGDTGDELLAAVERHIDAEHRSTAEESEPETAPSHQTITEVEQ